MCAAPFFTLLVDLAVNLAEEDKKDASRLPINTNETLSKTAVRPRMEHQKRTPVSIDNSDEATPPMKPVSSMTNHKSITHHRPMKSASGEVTTLVPTKKPTPVIHADRGPSKAPAVPSVEAVISTEANRDSIVPKPRVLHLAKSTSRSTNISKARHVKPGIATVTTKLTDTSLNAAGDVSANAKQTGTHSVTHKISKVEPTGRVNADRPTWDTSYSDSEWTECSWPDPQFWNARLMPLPESHEAAKSVSVTSIKEQRPEAMGPKRKLSDIIAEATKTHIKKPLLQDDEQTRRVRQAKVKVVPLTMHSSERILRKHLELMNNDHEYFTKVCAQSVSRSND